MGLLAHEAQEIFPRLASGEKDGQSIQSINYNGVTPALVKEFQVLKQRIQALESQKRKLGYLYVSNYWSIYHSVDSCS